MDLSRAIAYVIIPFNIHKDTPVQICYMTLQLLRRIDDSIQYVAGNVLQLFRSFFLTFYTRCYMCLGNYIICTLIHSHDLESSASVSPIGEQL